MRIEVLNDINQISEREWDQILASADLFQSHRFLNCIQKAAIHDARLKYVCFYEEDILVATSVISIFSIDLSLFAGNISMIKGIKKLFPNFFGKKICFCGIPLSAGQSNIRVINEKYFEPVVEATSEIMDSICREEKVNISIFKEFENSNQNVMFDKLGFIHAPSLPGLQLSLDFDSFNEYMVSLRAPFRRQILAGLKKINSQIPEFVPDYFESKMDEKHPVLTILNSNSAVGRQFYPMYLSVMERAETKLEILNKAFFELVFESFQDELELICMVYRGKVLGVFVCRIHENTMTFLWTGKEEDKDEFNTYPNLMTAMIYHAFEIGCNKIEMGQTAYYPKMRFGSQPYDLQFFIKSDNTVIHYLLGKFRKLLFPEQKIIPLNVFKINSMEKIEAS